jgi:hypothetical protein
VAENTDKEIIFGIPDEWKSFEQRNLLFFERFPNLRAALNTAFSRTGFTMEPIDRFVFFYGRLCCEDFFEVLLCCGNGYGVAALKLLRTLYERAVTLRYLHEHPEELDAFLDFHHVQLHKLTMPIAEIFGSGTIPEKALADIKTEFEKVKKQFMVTDCKNCGTEKLNHTWSKLDFVAMAKKTEHLDKLIVQAYYLPMRHGHATFGAILSRLEGGEIGGVSFIPTAQRHEADQALMTAQNILLNVLGVQEERFKVPGLREQIEQCMQDFIEMHSKAEQKSEPPTSSPSP